MTQGVVGVLRQMHLLWWLPINLCHLWCAAIDWPVHSLMLSFHDLRGLCDDNYPPFLVVWSSPAYHDDRHGRPMIACDTRWLTVKVPDVQWGPVVIYIFLCCKHSPVAFLFKGLDSPLQIRHQRQALTSIQQYWQDKWLVELIFVGKSMTFFP